MTTGRVITAPISRADLAQLAEEQFGDWIKAVVMGSEVERALRAHEAGRASGFEGAFARALELFDLTAADPRWHGHRCQEVLRAREEFCRLFFDPDVPPDSADGLRRYFFGFARAARMRHYRRGSETTP